MPPQDSQYVPPRRERVPAVAAFMRTCVSLAVFAVTFLVFLVAPLVVLGGAAVIYAVMRLRPARGSTGLVASARRAEPPSFGSGV
ncbi:hypothetical protein [Jatrophihabitans sp.]|uniref:hypothetical protein n=1 Tax=Jatrophihabitans sp. TaxID=1932789 RepID=UPI0030C68C98|nr:hypothetical protein [Jatrophihabitans sp.]